MKIKLSEVKLTQLNNNCIMLISKFSRVLKASDGTVLRLNAPRIVFDVFVIAAKTSNPELKQLASRLKREIKNHLLGDRVEDSSFQIYEVVEDQPEPVTKVPVAS